MAPTRLIALALGILLVLHISCRQSIKQRRYHAKTGIAAKIDQESGQVSMECQDPKTEQRESFFGRVTQATEIMINGISAHLGEIRPSDPVTVIVYWDEEHQEWIVTSVSVQREESYMLEKPLPAAGSRSTRPEPED